MTEVECQKMFSPSRRSVESSGDKVSLENFCCEMIEKEKGCKKQSMLAINF